MMTRREEAAADRIMHRLNIRAPSFRTPVEQLSGGNAQKVVLGRQLLGRPRLLVLAEPTQGVDVAAKQEIHTIVDELLAAGTSVVIATSDLAEAVRIADRFVIIRNGTTFAEFPRGSAESELLAAAAGDVSFD
jgi:rhamnose transport system ATP-binding protein